MPSREADGTADKQSIGHRLDAQFGDEWLLLLHRAELDRPVNGCLDGLETGENVPADEVRH